jgi:hypothetical protein
MTKVRTSEIVYGCCDCIVYKNDPEARIKIARHIHDHRLGTKDTEDDCPSCLEMADRNIKEWEELYGKTEE